MCACKIIIADREALSEQNSSDLEKIQEKINNAIKQVAQEHGYSVVITSDVALFTAVDITEEVLNAAK